MAIGKINRRAVNLDALDNVSEGANALPGAASAVPSATAAIAAQAPAKTASAPTPKAAPAAGYPWQDPLLRADVIKPVMVRFPEAFRVMLQFLEERGAIRSQNHFCCEVLAPAILAKIRELPGDTLPDEQLAALAKAMRLEVNVLKGEG